MSECRHETIVRVIGDPKSPHAHVCECGHVITFAAARATIADGRRYLNGVDVGPADPGSMVNEKRRASSRRGAANAKLGAATGARRRR